MKDTGIRRSGGHRILELKCRCGRIFHRQARRTKKKINLCAPCLKGGIPKLYFFPTYRLKEIIRNDGYTDKGTEYFDYLEDAKQVLWEREDREFQKMIVDFV